MYDYIIVGSGLYGSVFANEVKKRGNKCLVIEKRDHIGGNVFTKNIHGINVHIYGAHIFHTDDEIIWNYINQFADFNNYINSPLANYKGTYYNLPFNMNTFYKMWGKATPAEVADIINEQRKEIADTPKNLEEQAISLVGRDVYEKLIKGYTEKQWGRKCTELPPFIIKRLPVRMTYNNNYFNDKFQGVPIGGYTNIINKMLEGCEIITGTDYLDEKEKWDSLGKRVLYTGAIDAYFNYEYGALEYRSIRFHNETLDIENFQGNAVVNYTDIETPYTRIIEHKHFEFSKTNKTIISKEYSEEWAVDKDPYYPINDDYNNSIYSKYLKLALKDKKTIFGGRLGEYKYYNMDTIIKKALEKASIEI